MKKILEFFQEKFGKHTEESHDSIFTEEEMTQSSIYDRTRSMFEEDRENNLWYTIINDALMHNEEETIASMTQGLDIDYMSEFLVNFIKIFTLNHTDDVNDELKARKKSLSKYHSKYIKHIFMNENELYIKTIDGNIIVKPLNSIFPEFDDEIIATPKRTGKCHTKSVEMSEIFKNKHKIVTSRIHTLSKKSEYLHTWLETNLHGEEVCLDYTKNLIVNKDAYYRLFHVGKTCKIDGVDFNNEKDKVRYLIDKDDLYLKAYLSSRNETLEVYDELKKSESECCSSM